MKRRAEAEQARTQLVLNEIIHVWSSFIHGHSKIVYNPMLNFVVYTMERTATSSYISDGSRISWK